MSWCNPSSGGPSPARESCIVTPPIGMVSVVQLPVDVLTVAKAPPSRGLEPHATPAQTTRFAQGLATMRFCLVGALDPRWRWRYQQQLWADQGAGRLGPRPVESRYVICRDRL